MVGSQLDHNSEVRFAINHMVAPRARFAELLRIAEAIGVDAIEIRNDLPGVPILDGSSAAELKAGARAAGVEILSINALQRFDEWSGVREAEAMRLVSFAAACGAQFVVLCPVNDPAYAASPIEKAQGLSRAISGLKPLLEDSGVIGLIEPLGFKQSSLRSKRAAVEAIVAGGGGASFRIVHDTFHHYVAGEEELFPEFTGLVHLSGIDDSSLSRDDMRDAHRGLISAHDRLSSADQIWSLRQGGYFGAVSFEPFAESVASSVDVVDELKASMAFVRDKIE